MAPAARSFGTTRDGTRVDAFTLTAGDLEIEVFSYGATLRTFSHRGTDVTLGYDTLEPYLGRHPFFGSTVGRVAGRIGDGTFDLDGQRYELEPNEPPAMVNHLHGGKTGWDMKVWDAQVDGEAVRFSLVSPDGDNGYPGRVEASVTYRLDERGLQLDYEATTDAPTPIAPTNHAYFHLLGHDAGTIGGHAIRLDADRYAMIDDAFRFTGKFAFVDGRAEDLRQPASIEERLAGFFGRHGSMYVLNGPAETLRPVAEVIYEGARRRLAVATTESCLQLYTGVMLDPHEAKDGARYDALSGFCLEAQAFPDLMHDLPADSPSRCILRPGEVYRQTTRYDLGDL